MYTLINGQDLLSRGVTDLSMLRPVLNARTQGMDEHGFVTNATLRRDEWESIDDRVNDVMRERLTVVDDLRSRGLVTPLSIGSILRTTERLSDFIEASVSYDGDTDPDEDKVRYTPESIPVPVISHGFRLNWRQLAASRERGDSLDVTAAEIAARRVRDRLQALITNGIAAGGPTGTGIPGLVSAANRLTVTLTYNWDSADGDPVGDVEKMLDTAYQSNLFGPFVLQVPKNYWATLQGDYSAQKGDRTFMERILAFSDIEAVRPNDALADDNVLLVQMTRDVIDLSEAQSITTVQWDKNPFVTNFRVLTVAGPHIKSIETDQGTTIHGIVHLS